MAAATGTATPSITFTPSPLVKYLGLTALLIFAVAATYLGHIFPDNVGLLAISAYIPTVFYFAAQDLESDTQVPNGLPNWVTFTVVTVATAIYGAIGTFVLVNYTITLAAFLAWIIVVLMAVFQAIENDKGASANLTYEQWALAGIGITIGLAGYYLANPMAGISAWITTVFAVVAQYIYFNTDGSNIVVGPVTSPPTPTPTPPTP